MYTTEQEIRLLISNLFQTNPNIHMNISLSKPKLHLDNVAATIKGVYPHLFRIEEQTQGCPRFHTLQYTDILTNHITILELENIKKGDD